MLSHKAIIYAGNFHEARAFAKTEGWPSGIWSYIDKPHQLRGLEGPKRNPNTVYSLWRIGTYRERDDLEEFEEIALAMGY